MTTEQIQNALDTENQLTFVRVYDFRLIPVRLLEQVKGDDYDQNYLLMFGNQLLLQENQLLYAMADKDNVIHGVLWAEFNQVNGWLFVNTLSVDKDFQDGETIGRALDYLREAIK